MTGLTRNELIEAAALLHDDRCSCDRKYRMSCPAMASAVLEAGASLCKEAEADASTRDLAQ